TSHMGQTDRVRATRFGAQLANPLLCCILPSGQSGKLPADKFSFCIMESGAVVLQCMKRAEDGRGIVIRLREVQDCDAKIRLHLPGFKFTRAAYTNLVEEDIQHIDPDGTKLDVTIKANAILTLRCW
ncbi:MAG: glycosyl hydrolase-related protein, partial [Planctomycetota bacterium]